MNNLITNKKSFIIIAGCLGVSLLIVILGIIYTFINSAAQDESTETLPTTSISPFDPEEENLAEPPIHYDESDEEKLLEIVKSRPQLSEDDRAAKARILAILPSNQASGFVYTSSNVVIEYVNGANSFMAEILTRDVEGAKAEAVTWFKTQGMSQDGICKLPVVFYLNFDLAEALRGTNATISTLAPDC